MQEFLLKLEKDTEVEAAARARQLAERSDQASLSIADLEPLEPHTAAGPSMMATGPTSGPQANETIDRFSGHRQRPSCSSSTGPPDFHSWKSESESPRAAIDGMSKGKEKEKEVEPRKRREEKFEKRDPYEGVEW